MKRGSEYAKRLKKLHQQMLRQFGKQEELVVGDPLEQLIIGILSVCASETKATAIFQKLQEQMVDFNELRVTPFPELAEMIDGAVPLPEEKARRIVAALNEIRRREETLDLSFLKQRGRREAREYLESLEGVDRYTAASVVLFSLDGHAIPIDDLTVYVLRKERLVDPTADAAEVQGFLERHIPASDCKTFVRLLNRYVISKTSRVQVEKLPELLSPPPAHAQAEKPAAAEVAKASAETDKATGKKPAASSQRTVGMKKPSAGKSKSTASSRTTSSVRKKK